METNSFRTPSAFRRFSRPMLQYSVLITSVLATKFLHLYIHSTSIPFLLYCLYMPTFMAIDVINAVLFWVLVHLNASSKLSILLGLGRSIFWYIPPKNAEILSLIWYSLMILGASAVQISFFTMTGQEIKWKAAKDLASNHDGFRVAMSGGVQVVFISTLILTVAFTFSQPFYYITQALVGVTSKVFGRKHFYLARKDAQATHSDGEDVQCFSDSEQPVEAASLLVVNEKSQEQDLWRIRLVLLSPVVITSILLYCRPAHFPYAHMSQSLPYTLAEIWYSFDGDFCEAGHFESVPPFPFQDLIAPKFWEPENGKYVGWRPGNITAKYLADHHSKRPLWLPDLPTQGLERWYKPQDEQHIEVTSGGRRVHHGPAWYPGVRPVRPVRPHRHGPDHHPWMDTDLNYDPVLDPLRVSNLDQEILTPLADALKERDIKIKHIVFLALESTRKDVFPIKKDSHIHQAIMRTHGFEESATVAENKLAVLTTNAELLTGEDGGFGKRTNDSAGKTEVWRNLAKDRGGINIQGAFTGSTTSLKSFLESHCGVQPLAVDFTVEARREIYQPCIPSILKIFNNNKAKRESRTSSANSKSADFSNMPWRSVYVQAITDHFDHQDVLNDEVGFDEIISKNTLMDPNSAHYPPTEKPSNYFGFPESQVKPYLEDIFRDAEKTGERLFLSHLTSTTHHPWNLPEAAGENFQYLKQGRWRKEHELNRYLNTIKYIDNWIGEIMDLLDRIGVAQETLVVMVGDHGMAFEEDSPVYSTFENGHISNMRVPFNFHHPSLPRMQLEVNATSLSIIPTILDLLVATSSVNKEDTVIATDLIQQYEGQSLIRPYQVEKNGRQAWNVAVINAGGALLSVSSAAVPYRLVMPICKPGAYRFTDNDNDPHEEYPTEGNTFDDLYHNLIRTTSAERKEARWVQDAVLLGKWWTLEQRRRWRYNGASLQDDRTPSELEGAGAERKEHWWDTKKA